MNEIELVYLEVRIDEIFLTVVLNCTIVLYFGESVFSNKYEMFRFRYSNYIKNLTNDWIFDVPSVW